MKYQKQVSFSGSWVKANELTSAKAKIVSETIPQESQFQDKNGNVKNQDVAKVRFEGTDEPLNVSLNRATINGLIDAYGEDSVNWMNKTLTVETEKMRVAGKAVTALYLIPEGYKRVDDENGYAVIVKQDKEIETIPSEVSPTEVINPDDIDF